MKKFLLMVFLSVIAQIGLLSQINTDSVLVQDKIRQIQKDIDFLQDSISSLQSSMKLMQDSVINRKDISKDSEKSIISTEIDSSRHSIIKTGTEVLVRSLFGVSKQLGDADNIINKFDALPSFGIYKDNFFIVGTELFERKDEWNSDAKFQVSIRQRLTNSILPFKTYMFLTYTQKAFWDIFRDSFPFRDLNYNPTMGIGRALVYKNRLLGSMSVQIEHESNGKDGDDSRSWNKLTFGAILMFDNNWSMESKIWIPIVDGDKNKDIVQYAGWGRFGVEYMSDRRKYSARCVMTNRSGGFFNANVTLNLAVRIFNDDNQYLFMEYYNGYGESMLDYKEHRNRLRLGIVIRSDFINLY